MQILIREQMDIMKYFVSIHLKVYVNGLSSKNMYKLPKIYQEKTAKTQDLYNFKLNQYFKFQYQTFYGHTCQTSQKEINHLTQTLYKELKMREHSFYEA